MRNWACVPLPAPGMPSNMIFMACSSTDCSTTPSAGSRARSSSETAPHAPQVRGGVDPRMRRAERDRHGDAIAVCQRAQLLERLEALDGRRRKAGKPLEDPRAVGVDAEMAVDGQAAGNGADAVRKRVARPGYRRAAE